MWAAFPLGGSERFELVANALLSPVADVEPMICTSNAGTALLGQRLPPPHPRAPVIYARRADDGRRGVGAASAGVTPAFPGESTLDVSMDFWRGRVLARRTGAS
jgi:hypothetical protein